jgi:tagatose 6-phosphate kinase
LRKGAGAVVVSLGGEGLVASTSDGEWHAALSEAIAGNPTGAGDACVAALSAGVRAARPWPDVLGCAVACAGAAVEAPVAGRVDPARVRLLRADVVVREVR